MILADGWEEKKAVGPLPVHPRKLYNLWDMIWFSLHNFGKQLLYIDQTRRKASDAVKEAGRNCQVDGVLSQLVVGERLLIYHFLTDFSGECAKFKLNTTYQRAFELMVQVGNPHQDCYWTEIESGMKGIQWAIEQELLLHTFVYIPQDKSVYFECDGEKALFGGTVYKHFKSARIDIKSAGNCFAADLHTATIFHLMRAAELGMRALATHLKIKVKKIQKAKAAVVCPGCSAVVSHATTAKIKLVPLDYAMWEEVLRELEKKIEKIKNSPKGKNRTKDYEFYHSLILELNAFKDLWRNEVSHCRRDFEEADVKKAFPHIKKFMEQLSTRVRE